MPCRRAPLALSFALAIGPASATKVDDAEKRDIERMTPAQLQAAKVEQGLRTEHARAENAALRRRVEQLERQAEANAAKRAEVAAALEDLRARLAQARSEGGN